MPGPVSQPRPPFKVCTCGHFQSLHVSKEGILQCCDGECSCVLFVDSKGDNELDHAIDAYLDSFQEAPDL